MQREMLDIVMTTLPFSHIQTLLVFAVFFVCFCDPVKIKKLTKVFKIFCKSL